MINLINANFAKLFKSAVFKVSIAIMAFIPAFTVLANYAARGNKTTNINGIFNTGHMFIGFVIPVLVTLFLGQDYSDNTIRNKLAAGHTRLSIYLSDLIVSFCGGVILQLACIISGCVFALPLYGKFSEPLDEIIKIQLLGLCLIAVYTALTTFITMIITNKTYAVVVSIMTAMTLFMAGMGAYQYVTERKMLEAKITAKATDTQTTEMNENKLAYIIYETVPSSQACILSEGSVPKNSIKIVGYDMLSTTTFTLLGILLYRKKDIK